MNLYIPSFIEHILSQATYEYDEAASSWAAWVDSFPGVYAQNKTIEMARHDLASVIEDFIIVSLREGHPIPGFISKHNQKVVASHVA
ncbi:MAG: type II toxin-antitoxin system HicB family antitoxin [Patescibacteria group bacterium]